MKGVTRRQIEVLATIDAEIRRRKYPPTVRELAFALGLRQTSTVWWHIEALCAKGLLERVRMLPRTLVVTEKGKAFLQPLGATYGEGNSKREEGEHE